MGTHFFKGNVQHSPQISGGSQNMEARAIGSSTAAGGRAGTGAQKALSAAMFKPSFKKSTGSAAYAPGPKKT
jgi:hypothetical protein